ncbi:MAG: protoheme IX farnesyltransferase [Acidobacteria bacterium]|nr:protoheme IX farnesyltransferase [Acidobacteriota bacterium]
MKEFVLEATTDVPAEAAPLALKGRLGAFVELTKPRITFLIVLTSAAGFCLGSKGGFDYLALFNSLFGIALLSSGIATLNQYMERGLDARMRRTLARPLPAGKVNPQSALVFGLALTLFAEVYLALFVNLLTAAFGVSVIVGYLLCYTPLKTRSSLSTVVGAFPGAMPPLMGWTSATGTVGAEAWALFAILFAWQFPHFLAIAWMYREDYARAGIRMLPVVEPACRITAQQIVIWSLLLVPVSLFPAVLGTTGALYFYGALVLGLLFLGTSVHAALAHTRQGARRLLLASVLYLPVLFGLMVFNK